MDEINSHTCHKLSYRDPAGSLFNIEGRMIRLVKPVAAPQVRKTLSSVVYQEFLAKRFLPSTRIVGEAEMSQFLRSVSNTEIPHEIGVCIEHERIPFPSFPNEWGSEMLWQAASLTLKLGKALSKEGLGLKDATPFNVLFRGPNPVFIDFLSIERRMPGDSLWPAFGQFVRTFLTPLLANKYFSMSMDMIFLARREGLEPHHLYPMTSILKRVRQPFFSLITVPFWLARFGGSKKKWRESKETALSEFKVDRARYIYESLLSHLDRLLNKLKPIAKTKSNWSSYMEKSLPYDRNQFAEKVEFVSSVFDKAKPKRVLDVGCNTGFFSIMAAERNASVVAIDSDEVAVNKLWRQAHERGLDILPLVMSLNRPTPSVGWNNNETESFLNRARGHFDMVCLLAVLHHIVYGDGISLPEVIRLIHSITTCYILVEFMNPSDISVQEISRQRTYIQVISRIQFEQAISDFFDVIETKDISGGNRTLYWLKKRQKTNL